MVAEELLLLCTDDTKGTDTSWGAIGPGLRAALLFDLALQDRIIIEGGDESADIRVRDSAPTGDDLLDERLAELEKPGEHRLKDVVAVPLGLRDELRDRLLQRLVGAGVLSEQTRRVLGLFRSVRYPEFDAEPEREIRSRIEQVLTAEVEPDARTAALISLLSVTGQLARTVPGGDDKAVEERARRIADGSALPAAVRQTNEQLAALASTLAANAAVIAATTATNPTIT